MITLTDLFCGAGGSSTGAVEVPGVQVVMAANHWALAIETHNTNHPSTDHDCADISQVDPRRYPRTDILWASPECTNHSQAKGRKRITLTPDLFGDTLPDEAAERSRATMWDVPRFAEHHRYRAVIVENVVDAAKWVMWPAWLHAMECLGYDHHVVWLNSMHAHGAGLPAPQSRDRMYVVFWRRGDRRPDLERWTSPQAWCSSCERIVSARQVFKRAGERWGRYRAQYVYRCPRTECRHQVVEPGFLPALVAIDWSLAGERIGDRARPLAPKTRARIAAGLRKYARPIHLEAAGHTFERPGYARAWPVTEPLKTLHTSSTKGVAWPPLLVPVEGRDGKAAVPADEPMRTQTARNETGVMVPPFIAELRGGGSDHRPVTDPLATIVANGNHHGLVEPPFIYENRFVGRTRGVLDEPLSTIVAAPNCRALIMRNNTGGSEMCTPTTEVLRTLTTAGHQSLIRWDAVYPYDSGELHSIGEPLPTQTTVVGDALLGAEVAVDDCMFRMLEPHEIKLGMAFPESYLLLGNKREKVRLAGNAVTPPAARDLIAAVAEALS